LDELFFAAAKLLPFLAEGQARKSTIDFQRMPIDSPNALPFDERLDHARTGVLYIFSNIEDVKARYATDIVSGLLNGMALKTALQTLNSPGTGASATTAPAQENGHPQFPTKNLLASGKVARDFALKKFAATAASNLELRQFFQEKISKVWEVVKNYLSKVFFEFGQAYFTYLESLRDDLTKLTREIVDACLVLATSGLLPWYRTVTGVYDSTKDLYKDAFRTLTNFFETGPRRYNDGFAYDLVTGVNGITWLRSSGSAIDLTAGMLAAPLGLINGQMGQGAKYLLTILKSAAAMFFRLCEKRVLLKLRDESVAHLKSDGYYSNGAFTMGQETEHALTHNAAEFAKWFSFYSRWPTVAALTVVSGLVTDREIYARLYGEGGAISGSGQVLAAVRSSQDNQQLCRRYLDKCGLKIKFGNSSLQAIIAHMMKLERSFALAGKTPNALRLEKRRANILKVLRMLSSGPESGMLWT
jgi:hypothetical protein